VYEGDAKQRMESVHRIQPTTHCILPQYKKNYNHTPASYAISFPVSQFQPFSVLSTKKNKKKVNDCNVAVKDRNEVEGN